jgi:lipoate---protein ligase
VNQDRIDIGFYGFDEDLIAAAERERKACVRVQPFDGRAVVLGRGSRADVELNIPECLADGVTVLRRRGGGCAVFLDEGNIIVSAAAPARGLGGNHEYFRLASQWLIGAIASLGVEGVRMEGTSDLAIGDRKIGGASIHRGKTVLYYSTTLLARPDAESMERYLAHPPKEPPYRRGRSHRDFVGSLPPVGDLVEFSAKLQELLLVSGVPAVPE